MDHTMDCTRSTLLITKLLGCEEAYREVIEKAIDWTVANKNSEGWPDYPGDPTDLERTCDGLDVLLKYEAWCQSDSLESARRWGYATGTTRWINEVARSA